MRTKCLGLGGSVHVEATAGEESKTGTYQSPSKLIGCKYGIRNLCREDMPLFPTKNRPVKVRVFWAAVALSKQGSPDLKC